MVDLPSCLMGRRGIDFHLRHVMTTLFIVSASCVTHLRNKFDLIFSRVLPPPPSASGIPVIYGAASGVPVSYGAASGVPVIYGAASGVPVNFGTGIQNTT